MLNILFRRFLPVLSALSMIAPVAQAAVQNRIAAVGTAQPVALEHSVSPKVNSGAGATDLGDADGAKALNTITLRFVQTGAQKAALIQLLEDQQNPASASYHRWLTPEQFAAKFGMSSADLSTVSQWLVAQGFKVTNVARSGTFLQASGTVAQAQAAFKTSIHRVSVNGEEHIANVTPVALPAGIAAVVGSVAGLDDFKMKPHSHVKQVQASTDPKFTSSISGNTYIAPGDFYTIYDVKPLLSSSINGTGITIAVVGQTDISLSDVAAFRSAAGLVANAPTVKLYGTDPGTQSGDIDEAQLDVEWSGAVAPSASILYVNSTDVINSLTLIIDNKLAPIASISYGDCEAGEGAANLTALNSLFMQANAQGITIVGPSGDSGATDCDYHATSATHGLGVDFPASSPYVTGLGGTMFNEGTGTYFSTTNDSNAGSAISYIPEVVWNETTTGGELSAGGGGASVSFAKPSWQSGTGVPADSARDVPDVSLNAASNHDGYLFCSQGSCVNGFRTSATPTSACTQGNCLNVVGGTSVATPAFAGILALVEQKTGSSIGNANPVIYALANSNYYNTVFHDVTVGNNDSPCTVGSTGCPSGGSIGYSANVGYDLTTGWGSVDAYNLANTWTLVSSGGTGSTGADFTLTPASTTVTVKAGADASGVLYTVTPVNGFTGSVAFTATTTSSSLNATYSFSATPITISSTTPGTTTLTLSAFAANAKAGTGQLRLKPTGSASMNAPPSVQRGWYAGSGAVLACVVLLMIPKRRGWSGLFAAVLAFGAVSAMTGCGSSSSSVAATTNATAGTYTILVTATGTNSAGTTVSHTSTVTFVVQ